jgi:mRNA interferase MazF
LKRGEVVTVALSGDYGKPRPAIIVQSDQLAQIDSVLICLITSDLRDAPLYRVTVDPTPQNGLRVRSQIQADKIFAAPRARIDKVVGVIDDESLDRLNGAVALAMGLLDRS